MLAIRWLERICHQRRIVELWPMVRSPAPSQEHDGRIDNTICKRVDDQQNAEHRFRQRPRPTLGLARQRSASCTLSHFSTSIAERGARRALPRQHVGDTSVADIATLTCRTKHAPSPHAHVESECASRLLPHQWKPWARECERGTQLETLMRSPPTHTPLSTDLGNAPLEPNCAPCPTRMPCSVCRRNTKECQHTLICEFHASPHRASNVKHHFEHANNIQLPYRNAPPAVNRQPGYGQTLWKTKRAVTTTHFETWKH